MGPGSGHVRSVMIWIGKRLWLMTRDGEFDLGDIRGRMRFRIEMDDDGKPYVRSLGDDAPREAT